MKKKESYRHLLPHFQQPGQSYFITWMLKDAVPAKAFSLYSQKLALIKAHIDMLSAKKDEFSKINGAPFKLNFYNEQNLEILNSESLHLAKLKFEYYSTRKRYMKAYDNLLDAQANPYINLTKPENLRILFQTLQFWDGKKLKNIAFCIMPNHIHWVIELFEKDIEGNPVYLQDILQSIKRFSSNRINKMEFRSGPLWQKESFDTTIRNERHLFFAKRYTLNNPVKAGFVTEWQNWEGSWCSDPAGTSDF